MAEANQDLVQQLEQNLASFEAAGLTEEAEGVKAKLARVKGGKSAPKPAAAKPARARKPRAKAAAKRGKA